MTYFDRLVERTNGKHLFDYHPNGHVQRCRCGQAVFFDNLLCVRCSTDLGYHPTAGDLLSIESTANGQWRVVSEGPQQGDVYTRCANAEGPAQCNWLATDPASAPFCIACSLNLTIPDLTLTDNAEHWARIEQAKRRLVAQLILLGLPVVSRKLDAQQGLGFNFLRQTPGGDPVMTGHADGVITLNVDEADPSHREKVRENMHEPYRTLLGHFRHESGHYYWDRLVRDSAWLEPVRQLFGDDRLDYQEALQKHYNEGSPADWNQHYISSYAATHPWEDWAETWAHYLHMTDTLNVALDYGFQVETLALQIDPFDSSVLAGCQAGDADPVDFLAFINRWVQLSSVLNVLARSMGMPDLYPFVLNVDSLRKLFLVHAVVSDYGSAG